MSAIPHPGDRVPRAPNTGRRRTDLHVDTEDSASRFPVQLVLLSLAFVALVAAVTWFVVSRSQERLIEYKALKIAEVVGNQATAARAAYARLAVGKLERDGFGASANSDKLDGHVPLPAQFLKELSERSNEGSEGLYSFRPISRWNLGTGQGLEDEFQRWAWRELTAQDRPAPSAPIDWRPAWRVEEVDGAPTLRYLQADPASGESCVNCHNALERRTETIVAREAAGVTPGRQWQRHQLLGAIEIDIPLRRAAMLAREQTEHGLLTVIAATVIGLAGFCLLLFVHSSRTRGMTRELTRQARRDSLTGLPNRLDFERLLDRMLSRHRDEPGRHAVMLLDLDDFKQINDTLGHEAGDSVLAITAKRLLDAVRESDVVARLGGDEFAVLLPDTSREDAERVARRMSASIDEEYAVADHRLGSGVSIGIALVPEHGTEARELVRCADVAMYVAKDANLPLSVYDEALDGHNAASLAFVNDVREAVRLEQFTLHFQPQYHVGEGVMVGVEALLRWHHPVHGRVSPERIIPVVERCGLVAELTRWVLSEALGHCGTWREAGYGLAVSVNLSASSLHDPTLPDQVASALADSGVPPDALVLEVTESAMMRDPEGAQSVLHEIEAQGVKVSVDDYGTGYCSLSYLNRLPVRELKLDRSFVQQLFDDRRDAVIVNATVELSHALGLSMVAEGVENARSLDYLRDVGCDIVQGYFLARPLPAEELTRRLPYIHRFTPAGARCRRRAPVDIDVDIDVNVADEGDTRRRHPTVEVTS